MSGTKIRENGAAAEESAEEMGRHFSRASDFVVDSEVSAHFDALLLYQEKWMLPQAQIATGASDAEDYSLKSLDLLLQDGVAQAVSDGAVASGAISAYTLERCGSSRRP